jgi:hypothetical protein
LHNLNKLCRRCVFHRGVSVAIICDEVSLRGVMEFPCVRKENFRLAASCTYTKLALHIPLGHGCAGTNVPFMLGAVVLFVIVWYNDSDGVWMAHSL